MSRADPDLGYQARVKAADSGSDALLRAMFRTFEDHADRTGKPLRLVMVELMNGVMP